MTNKEFITILLSLYKYTKDINIEISSIGGNPYYIVSAENPEDGDCIYCDGESFQNIIYNILSYFEENNIKVSTFPFFIPLKSLLNKEEREKYHDNIIKRQKEIEKYINETHWINELYEKTNPCINCKLNKKDSVDSIHYKCSKCHCNNCQYMLKHRNALMFLRQNYKEITQEEIDKISEILNNNKDLVK